MAVGIGEPKHARRYGGQLAPSVECLCHATSAVHRAYGLERFALTDLLNTRLMSNSLRAGAAGFVQGQATGDQQQLGGTFIVDTAGLIQYAYVSDLPGDHPNLERVLRQYHPQP